MGWFSNLHYCTFKDTLKTFVNFKNKQWSVWSNVFWYVSSESLFNTLYIDIKSITKNALFFLSRAPTHHSFAFNSWFLYKLKHKVRLSKRMWGISYFQYWFIFFKVYIFVQQKACTLWLYTLKRHNFFQNWNIRKATHAFVLLDLWFLSCNKNF